MVFAAWAVAVLGYEAVAIATGPRKPPTITEVVRRLRGPWQLLAAIGLLLIPLDHLVTEWLP